MKSFER